MKSKTVQSEAPTAVAVQRFVRPKIKDDPWVEWTCPHCGESPSDPASMKETTCGNGHTVYLGKVHESPRGYSRRAYKSRTERSRAQREEFVMHETYTQLITGAFRPNEKS